MVRKSVNFLGKYDWAWIEEFDLTVSFVLSILDPGYLPKALNYFIFEAAQKEIRNEMRNWNTLIDLLTMVFK